MLDAVRDTLTRVLRWVPAVVVAFLVLALASEILGSQQLHDLLETLTWPIALLCAIALLRTASGIRALNAIFGGLRRVKGLGFEFELSPQEAAEIKATLEEQFTEYRDRVKTEFDRLAEEHSVFTRCSQVAEQEIAVQLNNPDTTFQCTVYVEDLLFQETLYRLVDYYPSGGGAGKTYPPDTASSERPGACESRSMRRRCLATRPPLSSNGA